MQCQSCQSPAKRFGKDRKGNQRYRCRTCRKTFSERPARPLGSMRIPEDKAVLILTLLCEGSSLRAIERVTGCHVATILSLLTRAGAGCERLLAERIKGLPVQDVQADELWTYIRAKSAVVSRKKIADPDAGDAYCFIGLERHSKLVLAWHLGRRNRWDADSFMEKLSSATAGRFQLSTDGFNAYNGAVEYHLGARVDYAQVVKDFGKVSGEEARRYAPPRLIGQEKIMVSGEPDESRACTSHCERANWTLRGHLRRFTRLSNGFSRKKANLRAALALYFAYYNFCRMHRSIRMTPAMAANLTRKPWTVAELMAAAGAA